MHRFQTFIRDENCKLLERRRSSVLPGWLHFTAHWSISQKSFRWNIGLKNEILLCADLFSNSNFHLIKLNLNWHIINNHSSISIAMKIIIIMFFFLCFNREFLHFSINVRLITITNCKLLWSLPLLAFISILLQLLENSKSASLQDQMTNYHLENHSWSNNCISCSVEVVPYGTLIYQSNDITMGWNYFWHSILIIM